MKNIDWTKKFNDDDMASYAAFFNKYCAAHKIATFWWDTDFLIHRRSLTCFQKPVGAIVKCFPKNHTEKEGGGFVEESAAAAVLNMGAGWNLGNSLDAYKYRAVWNEGENKWQEELLLSGLETETCWFMPPTTKDMIHYVKSLGFNAVRLPVTWVGHLNSENQIDKEWMSRVQQVVDFVLDEKMYCIINVHHDGGAGGWIRACESSFTQFKDRFVSIVTQISNRFCDYDERLIFEGVNEMLDAQSSWEDPTDDAAFWVNRWNQIFVDTVRATGGNNLRRNLIVQAAAGKYSAEAVRKFKLPEDSAQNHLIFEFHSYDPQSFCWHQNPKNPDPEETAFWNEEKHGGFLKSLLDDFIKTKEETGLNVPVICGEYGAWPKEI